MDNEGCAKGLVGFIKGGGISFHPENTRIGQETSLSLDRFYSLLEHF